MNTPINPVVGSCELVRLYSTNSDSGPYKEDTQQKGFRPVFHLKPGLKIESGKGTQESPYELSL